jgi:hypothetical protein
MSLTLFEKPGCREDDLKWTNMSLSGFSEGTSRSYGFHVQGVDNL